MGHTHQGVTVSSVYQDLVLLVRLQETYDSISESIAERNSPPPEIRELQEANRLRQEELEEFERQMAAHEEEIKEVRKKQADGSWLMRVDIFNPDA